MIKLTWVSLCSLLALVGSSQPPPWIQGVPPHVLAPALSTLPPYNRYQKRTPPRYQKPTDEPSFSNGQVVQSFHVKADIRHRFATTTVTSFVFNPKDKVQELTFDLTLPKQAFIMHFEMEIDNKTYEGEVKARKEAKQQYQAAVDRGESAGHVRQAARHANLFSVSAAAAAGSGVRFTLTYQQLLRRSRGLYEYVLHLSPRDKVTDFKVTVNIKEQQPIKWVRTPALRTDELLSNEVEADNRLTVITHDRVTPETARVTFQPSVDQQGEGGVKGRFVVQYDVTHKPKGEVLVADGYFVHFYAPDLPSMPKDIIFVLDLSGSMSGTKIKQLKEAMGVILDDLEEHDRFNILTFSTDVAQWQSGLVAAGKEKVALAREFVDNMQATGMTNIDAALRSAVDALSGLGSERAGLVFFLTDGDPTQGEQDMGVIAQNVRRNNEHEAVVISLAFGSGADFDALKTISAQNSGFARKIYEASDAALQVSRLYREVSTIVMRDLSVTYLPSATDAFTMNVTDTRVPVVYNGTEVVICGMMPRREGGFSYDMQYTDKRGPADISFAVDDVTDLVIDDDVTDLVIDDADGLVLEESEATPTQGPRDYAGLVERMWAYLTVTDKLKTLEKQKNKDGEAQTKQEIIELAEKYKLVTPLTSMVVTRPDSDRKSTAALQDADDVSTRDRTGMTQHKMLMSVSRSGPRKAYSMNGVKGHRGAPMPYKPTSLLGPHGNNRYSPDLLSGLQDPVMPAFTRVKGSRYRPTAPPHLRYPTTSMRYPTTTSPPPLTTTPRSASISAFRERLAMQPSPSIPQLTHLRVGSEGQDTECVVLKKVDPGTYTLLHTTRHSTHLTSHPVQFDISRPDAGPTSPCGRGARMCRSVKKCVSLTRVCDGHDDCGDRSDETDCPARSVFDASKAGAGPTSPCGRSARMCRSVKKCVPLTRVCDGHDDCGDRSDETDCADPYSDANPNSGTNSDSGANSGAVTSTTECTLTAQTGCPRGRCKKVTLVAVTLTYREDGEVKGEATVNFSSGVMEGAGERRLRHGNYKRGATVYTPHGWTVIMVRQRRKPRVTVVVELGSNGTQMDLAGLLGDVYTSSQPTTTAATTTAAGDDFWGNNSKKTKKQKKQKKQKKPKKQKKFKRQKKVNRSCKRFANSSILTMRRKMQTYLIN